MLEGWQSGRNADGCYPLGCKSPVSSNLTPSANFNALVAQWIMSRVPTQVF